MPTLAETLYTKLKNVDIGGNICKFTMEKCEELAPLVEEIQELKKEKNAVILAHSYVSPEIIYGVADFSGDSYGLSKNAMETDADIIVFSAVKFMGDTAKLLNPQKEVLIPNVLNGCSLADSITGKQVQELKEKYPDFTFVCYINTTAEVKAECDVCVTSGNVYDIVETIPNNKIYFLPDKLMGQNVIDEMKRRGVEKTILYWDGTCYVHEEYDPDMIRYMRTQYDDLRVLSHPECSPEVLKNSDYVGSTAQMLDQMKLEKDNHFLMLTECGLTARLQVEMPDKKFVGTCSMCKYMRSNTLEDILRVLKSPNPEDRIVISENIVSPAVKCIEEMFRYVELGKQ